MEKYVEIQVESSQREEMLDLTPLVKKVIANNSYKDGICLIFVPHTTCGVQSMKMPIQMSFMI